MPPATHRDLQAVATGSGINRRLGFAMDRTEPREKMSCEQWNIGRAVAQRHHWNREPRSSGAEKILAEAASRNSAGQISIRERHQPRFHVQCFRATKTFESALLEHTRSSFACILGASARDFVENDRATLPPSRAVPACAPRRP